MAGIMNTLSLLEHISMQLGDILKANSKKASATGQSAGSGNNANGEASASTSNVTSGKTISMLKEVVAIGKDGGLKASAEGISALAKGIMSLKLAGSPSKVKKYFGVITKFIKDLNKIIDGKYSEKMKDFSTGMGSFAAGFAQLISTLSLKKALELWAVSKILGPETADKLVSFLSRLSEGLSKVSEEVEPKKIESLMSVVTIISKAFQTLSMSVLMLMGGLTALIALGPGLAVKAILAYATVMLITVGIIKLMSMAVGDKDLKGLGEATSAIKKLVICMGLILLLGFVASLMTANQLIAAAVIVIAAIAIVKLVANAGNEQTNITGMLGFSIILGMLLLTMVVLKALVKRTDDLVMMLAGTLILVVIVRAFLWIIRKVGSPYNIHRTSTGIVGMLLMTICFTILAIVLKKYVVPIGKKWNVIAVGLLVMGLTMLGLIALMKLLAGGGGFGKYKLFSSFSSTAYSAATTTKAILNLALMAAAVWLIGKVMGSLLSLFKKIDNAGWDVMTEGLAMTGIVMLGLIGAMKLLSKAGDPMTILKGEALLAGMEIILYGLAKVFDVLTDTFQKIKDFGGFGEFSADLGLMTLLIVGFGAVVTGIGALMLIPGVLEVIATGAAVFVGLELVMMGMIATFQLLINFLSDPFFDQSQDEISDRVGKVPLLFKSFFDAFSGEDILTIGFKALGMTMFSSLLAASMLPLTLAYFGMRGILTDYAEFKEKYGEMAPLATSLATGLKEFFINLNDAFDEMSVDSTAVMSFISTIFLPTLEMLSKFIDVVEKVATMHVITGYDENGNPIYKTLPPDVFEKSAEALGNGFKKFIGSKDSDTGLVAAFENLSFGTAYFMYLIEDNLRPVLEMISQFVDLVNKVATLNVITGYDENGNPMFTQLPPDVFEKSAEAIGNGFYKFMTKLKESFESMSILSVLVMMVISDSMKPIMDSVSSFVDAIIKLSTARYIEDWEVIETKDGKDALLKPVYGDIPGGDKWAEQAAETIANSFEKFMKGLNSGMKSISFWTMLTIEDMSEVLQPIMDSVSSFVDCIIKLATANYITGYDEKGKPMYEKLEPNWTTTAATTLVGSFNAFLTGFTNKLKTLDDDATEAMETMKDILKPVMDSVASYTNSIIMMASNHYYIKGYDVNGNPMYDTTKTVDWKGLGSSLATSYFEFLKQFIEEAKKQEELIDDSSDLLEALATSVQPINQALSSYIDMLTKLFKKIGGAADDPTSGEYAFTKLGDATAAITGALSKLFDSTTGLTPARLAAWGMDDRSNVQLASTLKSYIGLVVGTIKTLNTIAESNSGENKEDSGAVIDRILSSVSTAIMKFSTDKMALAATNIKASADALTSLTSPLRDLKANVDSTTSSLDALTGKVDAALYKSKQKREKAIKEVKDNIDSISTAIDKVNRSLDTLAQQPFEQLSENFNSLAQAFMSAYAEQARQYWESGPGAAAENGQAEGSAIAQQSSAQGSRADQQQRAGGNSQTTYITPPQGSSLTDIHTVTMYFGTQKYEGRISFGR